MKVASIARKIWPWEVRERSVRDELTLEIASIAWGVGDRAEFKYYCQLDFLNVSSVVVNNVFECMILTAFLIAQVSHDELHFLTSVQVVFE